MKLRAPHASSTSASATAVLASTDQPCTRTRDSVPTAHQMISAVSAIEEMAWMYCHGSATLWTIVQVRVKTPRDGSENRTLLIVASAL